MRLHHARTSPPLEPMMCMFGVNGSRDRRLHWRIDYRLMAPPADHSPFTIHLPERRVWIENRPVGRIKWAWAIPRQHRIAES